MAHMHPITDADARFVVNDITRKIINTSSRKATLIYGQDMALCTKAESGIIQIDNRLKAPPYKGLVLFIYRRRRRKTSIPKIGNATP